MEFFSTTTTFIIGLSTLFVTSFFYFVSFFPPSCSHLSNQKCFHTKDLLYALARHNNSGLSVHKVRLSAYSYIYSCMRQTYFAYIFRRSGFFQVVEAYACFFLSFSFLNSSDKCSHVSFQHMQISVFRRLIIRTFSTI